MSRASSASLRRCIYGCMLLTARCAIFQSPLVNSVTESAELCLTIVYIFVKSAKLRFAVGLPSLPCTPAPLQRGANVGRKAMVSIPVCQPSISGCCAGLQHGGNNPHSSRGTSHGTLHSTLTPNLEAHRVKALSKVRHDSLDCLGRHCLHVVAGYRVRHCASAKGLVLPECPSFGLYSPHSLLRYALP